MKLSPSVLLVAIAISIAAAAPTETTAPTSTCKPTNPKLHCKSSSECCPGLVCGADPATVAKYCRPAVNPPPHMRQKRSGTTQVAPAPAGSDNQALVECSGDSKICPEGSTCWPGGDPKSSLHNKCVRLDGDHYPKPQPHLRIKRAASLSQNVNSDKINAKAPILPRDFPMGESDLPKGQESDWDTHHRPSHLGILPYAGLLFFLPLVIFIFFCVLFLGLFHLVFGRIAWEECEYLEDCEEGFSDEEEGLLQEKDTVIWPTNRGRDDDGFQRVEVQGGEGSCRVS